MLSWIKTWVHNMGWWLDELKYVRDECGAFDVYVCYWPDRSGGVVIFDHELDAARYALDNGMLMGGCDYGEEVG